MVLDGHYEPERASEHRVQAAGDRHGSSALIDVEQTVLVAVCDHVRQITVLACTTPALAVVKLLAITVGCIWADLSLCKHFVF